MSYSEKSIFISLLTAVVQRCGGYVTLYNIVAPLWGDADAISKFYSDAAFNAVDPEWNGYPCLFEIEKALANVDVALPPYPGTTDDPFALSPDGSVYADPAAANAAIAAQIAADAASASPDTLAAVGAEVIPPSSNVGESVPEFVPAGESGIHIAGE